VAHLGYSVNAVKCWLVVKEGLLQRADHIFTGTGVQVTSTGRPYLSAALGSTTFTNLFTQQCVSEWIEGVSHLSTFAETQDLLLGRMALHFIRVNSLIPFA